MDKGTKIVIGILLLPFVYEMGGAIVNNFTTINQTSNLRHNIEETIPDSEIVSAVSETGNSTGTGNHVDCVSRVTFSSDLTLSEVEDKLESVYELNDFDGYLEETKTEGQYIFYLRNPAPFRYNIQGH